MFSAETLRAARWIRGLAFCLLFSPATCQAREYLVSREVAAMAAAGELPIVRYKGKLYRLVPLDVITIEDGETPKPVPPPTPLPTGDLSKFVASELAKVPQHALKDATARGLSAAYSGLAKKLREGGIANPADARKQLHDRLTAALGVADKWRTFDAAIVAELNRRNLTADELPKAFEQIAAGLAPEGEALDPAILQAGIELVLAVLSKDQPAIAAAIGKLVVALLGSIGG